MRKALLLGLFFLAAVLVSLSPLALLHVVGAVVHLPAVLPGPPDGVEPLHPWRQDVRISLVSPEASGHTIHSYFNTSPESPDGKYVLFFASSAANGETGELRLRERVTGQETVLARDLRVEDAHRVACQQWLSGGKRVAFHSERDGEWVVSVVDLPGGLPREIARDRLSGWGQPHADLLPLYGPHWKVGAHRDLEIANVATGEIKTVLQADQVAPKWLPRPEGAPPHSIFFPVLSPQLDRVFFKLAFPGTAGHPKTSAASRRFGLLCYSLSEQRLTFTSPKWGHPSWHADSRTIVETSFRLIDSDTGQERRLPGLPSPGGDHPSASPDGRLIVTDTTMHPFGGSAKQWGILLVDVRGGGFHLLHQFDQNGGARSWRPPHPHPSFSADGRRIYFNVSQGPWTRLYVAEASK